MPGGVGVGVISCAEAGWVTMIRARLSNPQPTNKKISLFFIVKKAGGRSYYARLETSIIYFHAS